MTKESLNAGYLFHKFNFSKLWPKHGARTHTYTQRGTANRAKIFIKVEKAQRVRRELKTENLPKMAVDHQME